MGNCAASRLIAGAGDDDDDAVALCRDRKRLLKSAVVRRYALAESHASYVRSIHDVAAAIALFVARHSSSSGDYFVALPAPPSPPPVSTITTSDPSFLLHTPTEAKTKTFPVPAGDALEAELVAGEEREQLAGLGYLYQGHRPEPPSPEPEVVFGWDFFHHPFDEMLQRSGGGEECDLRALREKEGIPELEEDDDEVGEGAAANGGAGGGGGFVGLAREEVVMRKEVGGGGTEMERKESGSEAATATTPGRERELLDALRDLEDHFRSAFDAGSKVSRMLEVNKVQLQSGLEEIKENSAKAIQAITWHRSPSSLSSSRRSSLPSSSSSCGSWAESKSDTFDDYGGMDSGSHSQTLGRLYAWEKKLYEEVKAGEATREYYERKCLQLQCQDVKGANARSLDKTRSAVKVLYARIWVALRTVETISKRIQKLKDEELQPQLVELIQGLFRTWKVMAESHRSQRRIMAEVTSFACPSYGKFCTASQRFATIELEAELRCWRKRFNAYVAAQREYVEALDGWLSKFILPGIRGGAPPVICRDWLVALGRLPDTPVSSAMKFFVKDVRVLWSKQGEEQQQRRKVEGLAKEHDRRSAALHKAESKILDTNLLELRRHDLDDEDDRQCVEHLSGKKDAVEVLRKRMETEEEKHELCVKETERFALSRFKKGLGDVFYSLEEFSSDSMRMYDKLLQNHREGNVAPEVAPEATEAPEKQQQRYSGLEGSTSAAVAGDNNR